MKLTKFLEREIKERLETWYSKQGVVGHHMDSKVTISIIMNKYNQKPTDMFKKQDVTAYLTYIKILKDI